MLRTSSFWLAGLLLLCSCTAALDHIPSANGTSTLPVGNALPGLPPAGAAVKRVSDTAYYDLQPADIVESQGVDHWEFGFEFYSDDGISNSYAIFGVNPGTRIPTRFDVDAYCQDLWVALADYDRGCWRFLDHDGLNSSGMLALSDGATLPAGCLSEDGMLYMLLVCPAQYSVGEAVLKLYLKDNTGDNAPPQWAGASGVKAVEIGEFGANITWDAAVDTSGIAYYAVYIAPKVCGIDYSTPYEFVEVGNSSYYFMFVDEGYPYLADVLAIDAMGNATPANPPAEFSPPDSEWPDTILAEVFPGDKLVISWDDPAIDCGMFFVAPNMDEGDPADMFFSGRSFISGPDSVVSGEAEEWVQLRNTAPTGLYEFTLSAFDLVTDQQRVYVRIVQPDGAVRQDLGYCDLPGHASVMMFFARLYLMP